jgi:hypothetical protein
MHHNDHCEPKGFVKWFLLWRGVVLTVVLAAVSADLVTAYKEHLVVALAPKRVAIKRAAAVNDFLQRVLH